MACCCLPLLCCLYLIRAHEFLTHSLSLFHLASPSPPQPCSWPGRTHSLPLHALAMSVVKPELGLQPDSFPAGLLWCSPGATRYLRTRPVRQVVMARPTARLHRTRPGGCPPGVLLLSPSDRFCRASRLRRVPVPGWPAAVTFPVLTSQASAFSASDASPPRPCTSESRWVDTGQRTRTPTHPVSECSAIAGLVALTTAASRWRHCVPFVPFAAPLCSLFPRRVTCAPFENFYFVSLNPFLQTEP